MNTFEITIQRAHEGAFPIVVRHQPGPIALTTWAQGAFDLDLKQLNQVLPADRQYGVLLGQNIFRAEVRDAFVRALSGAKATSEPLRVWLIVEAEDLRTRHWEQLCAPFGGGRWDYLLLNQQTPFSLYLPSQIERRFPPIGRRDLSALLLVAGPEELEGDYGLAPFDVPTTVAALRDSLGGIPHDVLANEVAGSNGETTLSALCERLTARHYTMLFIVCHGAYRQKDGETILYFPEDGRRKPVSGSELITRLSRLESARGLPHFAFLSTCESADPQAESGLGGLGQRLVRELGMPAVLAMTDRVSIQTAQALSAAFSTQLLEHGEVDRALAEALSGLQGRYDITVPALFSRLGGRPLFSDALDREPTPTEIRYGLEQVSELLEARAPILIDEFQSYATKIQAALNTDPDALNPEARREYTTSLEGTNQLCTQALDISFNALALGQEPPEYDPRSPFRGLYPFRAQDREFFFGRQALVDELTRRLTTHNFLAVLGPSGCGKSSLVLAGLIPSLGVPMAYMTPGSDPPAQLENVLEEKQPKSVLVVDQFEELFTLCRDEPQRQAFLERLLGAAEKMRVVVTMRADFLGEFAAYPELRNAIEFHHALVGPMTAAELRRATERQADHVGLRFEAGLGEQILDDVQGEPGAMPLLQHALLLLWQRRHGPWLRWEEYTTIGGIQEAIAHTAEEAYKGLSEPEKVRMRDIFIRLTRPPEIEGSQEGARYTRRRVRLEELVPAGSDQASTTIQVNRLADARLVVTRRREETGEVEVEVAHEALIQHWPRLRNWLEENRAGIRLREALTQAARDWESLDRDPGALYRGARLAQVSEWAEEHPGKLNILEQEYLGASQELAQREQAARETQRQRELELAQEKAEAERMRADEQARSRNRLQRLSIGLVIFIIMAVAAAIFALIQREAAVASATEEFHAQETAEARRLEADVQRATAQSASTQAVAQEATAIAERNLAAIAQSNAELQARRARAGELAALAGERLDQVPDLAFLLSVEAYKFADTFQSRQALFESWTLVPQLTAFLHGHDGWVHSVAWSGDGRLASGSWDTTVILWDPESGQPEQTLLGHESMVTSVAWSGDGRLASGSRDGTVILWDLESGQPAQTLRGHDIQVNSVAWSGDGRLASGSSDSTVILWDLENGLPAQTLRGHDDWVYSVAWSGDGRLASGSSDGTVQVWNLNPMFWLEQVCQRAGRNLTQAEWAQYFPGEGYRETCPQWSQGE